MARWAQLVGNTVRTIVEADESPGEGWMDVSAQAVSAGASWDGQAWTQARKEWDGFAYLRRLTLAERCAIRAAAVTDPVAQDFIHLLDSAIASGTPIYSDDRDLRAAYAYFTVNPQGAPIFTEQRAGELMS